MITDNTLGQLEKFGFVENKIWEPYGNLTYFQCVHGKVFKNGNYDFNDKVPLCKCETAGKVRPNMFFNQDNDFNSNRSDKQ